MSQNTIEQLVGKWLTQTSKRGSENVSTGIKALNRAKDTGESAKLVTLICPNLEVKRVDRARVPVIHDSLVHDDRLNLRRGYVATQEIAGVHKQLQTHDVPLQHALVIVDNAIQWNPEGAGEANARSIGTLQKLLDHGLESRNQQAGAIKVTKMSDLVPKMREQLDIDFDTSWETTAQAMWAILEKPHHPVAGLLRRETKKEARYLVSEWGVRDEAAAIEALIRDQYALTATIGRLLPEIHAATWDDRPSSREHYILLDAINGPKDDPHNAEYQLYNGKFAELSGAMPEGHDEPFAVLRVMEAVALWSQRADREAPLTGKSLRELSLEASELTEGGYVPD